MLFVASSFLYELPEETQEGEDTFGMLVNGKKSVSVPTGSLVILRTSNHHCTDSTRLFNIDNPCEASFKLLGFSKSEFLTTKFDAINRVLSGRFEMTLTNAKGRN